MLTVKSYLKIMSDVFQMKVSQAAFLNIGVTFHFLRRFPFLTRRRKFRAIFLAGKAASDLSVFASDCSQQGKKWIDFLSSDLAERSIKNKRYM